MQSFTMRQRLVALTAAGVVCLLAGLAPRGAARAANAGSDHSETLAQEYRSLRMVCTQCHSLELVTDTPRTYADWYQTVVSMAQRGAQGTPRQFGEVLDYLHRRLTIINVNSANAHELEIVLDVPQSVAHAIVQRRVQRPFSSLRDLGSIPGISAGKLKRRARVLFFR